MATKVRWKIQSTMFVNYSTFKIKAIYNDLLKNLDRIKSSVDGFTYDLYDVNHTDGTAIIDLICIEKIEKPNLFLIEVFNAITKLGLVVTSGEPSKKKGRERVNLRIMIVEMSKMDKVIPLFFKRKDISVEDVLYSYQGQMSLKQAMDFQRSCLEVYDFSDKHFLVEILPVTLKLEI